MVLGACSGLVHRGKASHLHRVRRRKTNKHWKRRKGSLRTVRWIKAPVDKVEDNRCWSTRRSERAPGALFSWATCDKTEVAALP